MSLLEQEIKELRDMNRQLTQGTITAESVAARISIYAQTEKRAKMILQAMALNGKYGGKMYGRLVATNLIGDGTAIDVGESPQAEHIKCRAKGNRTIARDHCLDYSGDPEHGDTCTDCPHFGPTRRMLLG